jgi:hypothetical protein
VIWEDEDQRAAMPEPLPNAMQGEPVEVRIGEGRCWLDGNTPLVREDRLTATETALAAARAALEQVVVAFHMGAQERDLMEIAEKALAASREVEHG